MAVDPATHRPGAAAPIGMDVFKEMIDDALQGVMVHRRHKLLYINRAWADLHGMTVKEVMTLPTLDVLRHELERKRLHRYAADRMAGFEVPTRYRYRALHRSGRQIWVEQFVRVIDWQGEKAIQSMIIDVDDQEKQKDELRRQRQSMEQEVRQGTEALNRSNRQVHLYESIINQMSERISVIGTDYRFKMTNQANLDFRQRSRDDLIGRHVRETLGDEQFEGYARNMLDRCFAGETSQCEQTTFRPDGMVCEIEVTDEPFRDPDGTIVGAIVSVRDVTEAKLAEQRLRLFESLVEQVSDRISVIGRDYRYRLTNKANLDYHRKPVEAFLDQRVSDIIGQRDFLDYGKPELDRCFAGETLKETRSGTDGAGRRRMLDLLLEPYREADGYISGAVATLRDVTEAHRLSERLAYQASHDQLTGLVNRRAFEQQLQTAIRDTAGNSRSAAFCFIDLDQFKMINDTVGHLVGDQLLQQVAALLSSRVREADVLARLGGDEFGLLLRGCSARRAHRAAEKLIAALNDYRFCYEGQVFEVGASIGIAAINSSTRDISEVMSRADLACYAAKDNGRNRVHTYEKRDMFLRRRHEEMVQAGGIRAALDQNQFVLFAQPIVAVGDDAHHADRVEILLRMKDECGGLIMPSAFIPAAERYGFMAEIDRWVIKNTISQLTRGHRDLAGYQVSINLSGVTLNDETSLDFIRQTLPLSSVSPAQVSFEITETAAIRNLVRTKEFMQELKGWGCRFALDDFGSGLSSLKYLKRLPVDYLKIDGSFVRDLDTDHGNRAMIAAIHQMAEALGIETVAEGVEDQSTLAVLRDLGINFVQGYAVGRPMPFSV